MFRKSLVCLMVACLPIVAFGQESDEDKLKDVKCVVRTNADAKASNTAKYMKGQVYFCCNNCAAKFKEDPKPFTAFANHQLVATGQYKQTACPFTGREINEDQTVKIGKTKIGFCCGNCKGKVEAAEDREAKVELVFSKEAFKKGFKPAKKDEADLSNISCPVMGELVSADFSARHGDGQVYFCCKRCVAAFNKNSEKFAAAANQQLVETGQYKQVSCPFSGADVAEGTAVEIGELEIQFCCNNCQAKVQNADDDEARVEMIFSSKAFEKGFAKSDN